MRVGSIVQIVIIFVLITALIIGNAIVLEPQMESNITGLQAYFEEVLNFHPFAQSDDQLNLSRQGGHAVRFLYARISVLHTVGVSGSVYDGA